MAANFWTSSHYEQWMFDKADLLRMRSEDLKIYSEEEYAKFMIFWANLMQQIASDSLPTGPKTRMQVIATAIVYFKRFYIMRSFKDVDPFAIACSSLLLASKTEEHGQLSMSKMMSSLPNALKKSYGITYDTSSKNASVYDCEFILVEIMDCCLIVYQPYWALQSMLQDIAKDPKEPIKDFPALEAQCWKVVNDSLRSDACLLYPPHIIACASIIVGAELMEREKEIKSWLPELSIDLEKVMDCVRTIVTMYQLWRALDEKDYAKPLLDKLPKLNGAAAPTTSQAQTFRRFEDDT